MLVACVDEGIQNIPDNSNDDVTQVIEIVETTGNSSGSNGRVVASGDGAYYYTDPYVGIMKVTKEGAITVLSSDRTNRIHISDGWIYYQIIDGIKENTGSIYMLSTDGGEKAVFLECKPSAYINFSSLINNWIYFRHEDGMSRINIDSKTIEPIIKGELPSILGAKDEWMYLLSGNIFYKTYLDGSNKTLLFESDEEAYQGRFDGEWIYFTTLTYGMLHDKLYKMRLDGSDLTAYNQLPYPDRPMLTWGAMSIYVYDGWIYYQSTAMVDIQRLRRIKADSSSYEEFIEGKYLDVAFIDDWIFYRDTNFQEHSVYMMKLDKSEKIKLYSGPSDLKG
jgi:hypothetical protein